MDENLQKAVNPTSLPAMARLGINRCNLPAIILGSLTFQRNPTALYIDGVLQLHGDFFRAIDKVPPEEHAYHFKSYMSSSFLLDHPDEAGFNTGAKSVGRSKTDYLRMLRGWLFNPDGKEAAALKSWVQSRFGLLPRSHHGLLRDFSGENYQAYLAERSQALYNSNSLEAQLDLLFSYCQFEAALCFPGQHCLTLYRGTNRIDDHEVLDQPSKNEFIIVLNNLNSFTSSRDRACEFGDFIFEAEVPITKLLYFPGLLAGTLEGENEFLVIGGVYQIKKLS